MALTPHGWRTQASTADDSCCSQTHVDITKSRGRRGRWRHPHSPAALRTWSWTCLLLGRRGRSAMALRMHPCLLTCLPASDSVAGTAPVRWTTPRSPSSAHMDGLRRIVGVYEPFPRTYARTCAVQDDSVPAAGTEVRQSRAQLTSATAHGGTSQCAALAPEQDVFVAVAKSAACTGICRQGWSSPETPPAVADKFRTNESLMLVCGGYVHGRRVRSRELVSLESTISRGIHGRPFE